MGFALIYRMDLPNVKISGDTPKTGKGDPRIIEQALTEEVLVSMNRYGRIEHLVFPKRVQPEIRNILKSLLAGMQVIFPSRPSMAWTQDEANLTGNYLAEYRVDSEGRSKKLKINKRKVKYDIVKPAAALDDQALQADVSIGKSSTMINFDKMDGYISDLEFNEGLKITIGGQATQKITSRILIDLALIQKRKDDEYTKVGQAKWRDLIDTKIASLTAEGETMGLVSAEGEEVMKKRHFEQMIQGKSLQELFDTLHRLEVKEDGKLRYETLCQLEAFMNLYPQRIHEVTAMVLQERHGSNGISTITTAMEQVP